MKPSAKNATFQKNAAKIEFFSHKTAIYSSGLLYCYVNRRIEIHNNIYFRKLNPPQYEKKTADCKNA